MNLLYRNTFVDKNNYKIGLIALLSIIFITILVYSNSLTNDFTNWDDDNYVTSNPYIQDLSWDGIIRILFKRVPNVGGVRLTVITFYIDYHIWGLNPLPYHLFNLVFHLLNLILLYRLILMLNQRMEVALIVCLLFALHPLRVESIAWVSERKDVLYSFFMLLSLIAYINYVRKKNSKFLIISFVFAFLSYHSKIQGIMIPFVLFAFDFYLKRNFKSKRIYLEKIPFFLIIFFFIVKQLLPVSEYKEQLNKLMSLSENLVVLKFGLIDKFFLAGYSFVFYLRNLFLPINMSSLHQYPKKVNGMLPVEYYIYTVIAIIVIVAVVYMLIKKREKIKFWNEIVFGSIFYLICISIVMHFISIKGVVVVADRYTYMAYFGLFFIIAQYFPSFISNGKINPTIFKNKKYIVLGIFTIFFSYSSFSRTFVWKNGITLFTDVIEKNPKLAIAYTNRGNARKAINKDEKGAIEDYDMAIKCEPNMAFGYNNRGIVKAQKGNIKEAIEDFTLAIIKNPLYGEAYTNRASLYQSIGKFNEAIADYSKMLSLNPRAYTAYYDRALLYIIYQKYDDAIKDLNKALEINSKYGEAFAGLGKIKLYKKNYDGALEDFNKAINLNPNIAEAYNDRGNTYNEIKSFKQAIDDFDKAIKLKPKYAEAFNNRGFAKNNFNDFDGAIIDFDKAIEENKNFAEAYNNKGFALNSVKKYNLALEILNKAIKLNPKLALAYNNRGISYVSLNNYELALNDFNKAIELDPNYADAYNSRGNIKAYLKDYKGSISDLTKVISLNPNYAMAYVNRGNSKYSINNKKSACDDWHKSLSLGFSQANDLINRFCR